MQKDPSLSDQADLVIIGGGPNGAALALAAAAQKFSTVLVDARPETANGAQDIRNFALVRGSWHLMEAIDIAETLLPDAQALNGLEAVDGAQHWFGEPSAQFSNDDLNGEAPLGYMVEARHLQNALDQAVAACSDITKLRPARFASYSEADGGVFVRLENGSSPLKTQLLVGCDGVNSPVRQAAGIPTEGRSYGKSVFAANVALAEPHNGIARQLFTPEGPFALLPLTGNRANLAWYMKSGAAEALADLSVPEMEAELNLRFEPFAGRMELISPPLTYPLKMQLATRMVAPRVALVGDAAHRINPLAGQGLNLGFKDVAALIEVISDARHNGLDIGAPTTLEAYQNWRRFDATATALAMDGIDRAFSNNHPILKAARSAALLVADRLAPLRRAMARQASAAQMNLPKLLRGEPL